MGEVVALTMVPIAFKLACNFIERRHRHHKPARGQKFALGIKNGERLVGVATVGRPVSRELDDGYTLEVNRTCTDGTFNVNSKLYGASARIAKEMGYRLIVTYTLPSESGASLRAVGWVPVAASHKGSWTCKVRDRTATESHPLGGKTRWECKLTTKKEEDKGHMAYQSSRAKAMAAAKGKTALSPPPDKTLGPSKPAPKPAVKKSPRPRPDVTTDEPPAKRADEFPNISTFDRRDMDEAKYLMAQDIENQQLEKDIAVARAEGKRKLAVVAEKYDVDGMRWGQMATYYNGMKTRVSTSMDKFIKNLAIAGVDSDLIAEALEAAQVESKPFLDLKVKDLTPKPKADKTEDEPGDE